MHSYSEERRERRVRQLAVGTTCRGVTPTCRGGGGPVPHQSHSCMHRRRRVAHGLAHEEPSRLDNAGQEDAQRGRRPREAAHRWIYIHARQEVSHRTTKNGTCMRNNPKFRRWQSGEPHMHAKRRPAGARACMPCQRSRHTCGGGGSDQARKCDSGAFKRRRSIAEREVSVTGGSV